MAKSKSKCVEVVNGKRTVTKTNGDMTITKSNGKKTVSINGKDSYGQSVNGSGSSKSLAKKSLKASTASSNAAAKAKIEAGKAKAMAESRAAMNKAVSDSKAAVRESFDESEKKRTAASMERMSAATKQMNKAADSIKRKDRAVAAKKSADAKKKAEEAKKSGSTVKGSGTKNDPYVLTVTPKKKSGSSTSQGGPRVKKETPVKKNAGDQYMKPYPKLSGYQTPTVDKEWAKKNYEYQKSKGMSGVGTSKPAASKAKTSSPGIGDRIKKGFQDWYDYTQKNGTTGRGNYNGPANYSKRKNGGCTKARRGCSVRSRKKCS